MRHRPTPAVGMLAAAALLATLATGCSTAEEDAAIDAAGRYLDLIATGSGAELDELAAMTASVESAAELAEAADLLGHATQRIEDVEVADSVVEPESVDVEFASEADVFVTVGVTYQVGGTPHEDTLLLGRDHGTNPGNPSVWRVMGALTGTIGFDSVDYPSDRVQPFVGDVPVAAGAAQPFYPGVYPVQEKFAEYVESDTVDVLVLPGEAAAAPSVTLVPTQAAQDAVLESLLARFEQCSEPALECPFLSSPGTATELGTIAGVADPFTPGWWVEVGQAPTITLTGDTFVADGALVQVRRDDDSELTLDVTTAGAWVIDPDGGVPAVATVDVSEMAAAE